MADEGGESPFRYHLELTPPQLKVTHTALRALLDDFGHDEAEVHALIHEVLGKLPDEHAIRAIQLGREPRRLQEAPAESSAGEAPSLDEVRPPEGEGDPPPTVA